MKTLSNSDNILLRLDYFLSKQEASEAPVPGIEREDPIEGPESEQFEIEDKPVSERAGEDPIGKVQTKIYELVHRGGRTFERARTAWVNPDIAAQLEQRKRASDWIRTLGNYLPIYFVGGYVRDKFFKKVSKDIDIVTLVSLDESKKALTKLNIDFKEKNNSHARLQFEVGGMKVDLISTTPEDLLDNLRSRDFTINSIAQSVTGQFYDPTRGMEDIKLKWLRSPNNDSVKSFEEDPARILRGARFLADFPIKAHPSVLKGLKANADALSKLKKRRIGFELVKLMQTEKSWIAMQFLADNDQLKFICPDLVELTETKQRGKNHKQSNVWKHTMAALKHASSTDEILNLAILFHDIGKSQTATDDNKHFPDHDKKGAEMTTRILTELGLPKDVVKRVSNMVEHHLFIGKVGPKGDAEEYKKLALALGGDIDRFFKLSEADAKDHKEYDPSWLDTAHKRLKKIKGTKPKQAGTEELKKYQQSLLDESIELLLVDEMFEKADDDSKDYDPEGFHEGPRHGHYFKPGEREVGGKQVDVVQAPEVRTDEPWMLTKPQFNKQWVWHNTSSDNAFKISREKTIKKGVFAIGGKRDQYPGDVTIYARRSDIESLNPTLESFGRGQALYPKGTYSPTHEWETPLPTMFDDDSPRVFFVPKTMRSGEEKIDAYEYLKKKYAPIEEEEEEEIVYPVLGGGITGAVDLAEQINTEDYFQLPPLGQDRDTLLPGQDPPDQMHWGQSMPRYFYHKPPPDMKEGSEDKGIKAYPPAQKVMTPFKEGVVWMSHSKPLTAGENVKSVTDDRISPNDTNVRVVDITKLKRSNLHIANDGHMQHKGDIPFDAIVDINQASDTLQKFLDGLSKLFSLEKSVASEIEYLEEMVQMVGVDE